MMIVYIGVDINFHNNVTLVMVIDHLMLASCGTLTIVKIALIRLHRNNLLKNLVNASNDWTYITKQDHRQVMFRYTNLGRFVFFFQMGSTYFVIMPLIVESLLSFAMMPSQNVTLIAKSEKEMQAMQLPQEMICPFDIQIVCFSMCILQSIQLISTCTGNVGNDVFLFGVFMHLCGQLEVLSRELQQFHERKKNGCWKRSKIVTLIERHCLLLNLAKDIVGVLNIILIAQLILHALFICLIGLQFILSLVNSDFVLIMRSISSINILMIQLFIYSYMGETLSSKTQAISHAIYLSKWYNLPTNILRDVCFIIARANVPVRIKRWKNDVTYAMTPFKLLTWPIGLWPLQVYNIFSLIRCVLATCCLSTIVILPSMEFHMGCTNTEQNIDSLMLACCGLGVFKIICFRIYAKNLTDNYSSARNDYLTIKNAEYRAIMRKYAFMGRILSCFMVCFAYISVVIYSLIPLLGEDLVDDQDVQINRTNEDIVLDYPMPSRCALEYLHAPRSMYEFICIFEFIVLILTSTCNDSLFLNITLHMCGQVKILKADFINFVVSSPQVYDRFNDLIRRHNYLMELAKELTESISVVLLTQLFISSILLCIMGFQFILALKVHNVVVIEKSALVLCTSLMQLSVYSFVGDHLQMEEIGFFIYQSNWYNFPTKLARNLIFIIMRTRSPAKLLAGNFVVNIYGNTRYMAVTKENDSHDNPMERNDISTGNGIIISFHHSSSCLWNSLEIMAAVADWVSAKNDEKSYKIMKKCAFKSRLCTFLMLYSAFICGSLYLLIVFLLYTGNVNATDRLFIIPCGEFGNQINGLQYSMVIGFQTVQLLMICIMQSIGDSFYINVTLHLTGQLKVLKKNFLNFASKPDTQINHRKRFISLINRHCELTELHQNLEDTFNLIILFQLVIVTFLLALLVFIFLFLSGLRIIFCLKQHYYVESMKSILLLNYMLMQSLLYCYGGDFIQKGSEDIFHAMFKASWFTFPAMMMKDLNFAMMRSSYPFRFTVHLSLTAIMSSNDDIAYAMTLVKHLTVPIGAWPLQEYNKFALLRHILSSFGLVRFQFSCRKIFLFLMPSIDSVFLHIVLHACGQLEILKANFINFDVTSPKVYERFNTLILRHDHLIRLTRKLAEIIRFDGTTLYQQYAYNYIRIDEDIQVNISVKNLAMELPVPLPWTLGNYHLSINIYYVIFIVQYILLTLNCSGNVGNDILLLGIILHICGQMELLKIEFTNYNGENKDMKEFEALTSRHCYLMEHAELLINVISFVLLVQLLISCLIICLVGFQLILALKLHDAVIITKTTSVLSALLLQLFSYSFVGDYLKRQMEDIAHSIYSFNWYYFPLKLMRNVLFVIMRSQQPVQLLAGRFVVVTIETYMSILKNSFSYLSVLRRWCVCSLYYRPRFYATIAKYDICLIVNRPAERNYTSTLCIKDSGLNPITYYYILSEKCVLRNIVKFFAKRSKIVLIKVNLCILCITYFSGFQFILALKSHDVVMIIKTITVMGVLLLQLFFYSFVGDYLKCQMEDIAQSIYSCNWYCFPLKLMRNVLFVIMRSQQPVQLIIFFTYLASSIFTLAPMITGDENVHVNVSIKNQAAKLPVPITFLGDLQIPTGLYFVISTVQYFILLLTGTSNCGNDSLFLAITLHVCGQLELLKIEFTNYGMKSKNINEYFSILTQKHRYLIELAELLSDVISIVFLVQVLFSCLIISLIGKYLRIKYFSEYVLWNYSE
ncbi:OR13A protein, partial [Pseudoatta argentina]